MDSITMLHGMTPDDVRRLVAETVAETIKPALTAIEEKIASVASTTPDRLGTRDMLSAKEIAERFGIHRVTVWRWQQRGLLKGVKVGSVLRFRRDDVEELIRRGITR